MRINKSMAHVVSEILVVDEMVLQVGDTIEDVSLALAYLEASAVLIDIQQYPAEGGISMLFHTPVLPSEIPEGEEDDGVL